MKICGGIVIRLLDWLTLVIRPANDSHHCSHCFTNEIDHLSLPSITFATSRVGLTVKGIRMSRQSLSPAAYEKAGWLIWLSLA